jgi:hypothetical protein
VRSNWATEIDTLTPEEVGLLVLVLVPEDAGEELLLLQAAAAASA